MNNGKYVFTQVTSFIPWKVFSTCVKRYKGNYKSRNLFCSEQFLAMMFGQLTHRESLRDVVSCIQSQHPKLYHLGFRSNIFLSTLAKANEKRDFRIYRDFAQILIEKTRSLYLHDENFPFDIPNTVYILDSTVIELCLSIFKWAAFQNKVAGVKIHILLDTRGSIPTIIHITKRSVADIKILDRIPIEQNAYYVMDRGYTDFKRLFNIHKSFAFFVVRAKHNFSFKRLYSNLVDKNSGLRCDQIIRLKRPGTLKLYPEKLRRIKYYDSVSDKYYVFLTNDLNIEAKTVADLYKYRWQIEIFNKWIKQHLKIETFWGKSYNAIKIQIYVAISTYLIVLILKKKLKIKVEIYKILQILSVSLFDKSPLEQLFVKDTINDIKSNAGKQLLLLDP